MRWAAHLFGAAFVGILVVIWEQFSGVSISQRVMEIFYKFGVETGLTIAILVIATLAIWAKSSSG